MLCARQCEFVCMLHTRPGEVALLFSKQKQPLTESEYTHTAIHNKRAHYSHS